ncbi:MAG: ZIP family metal transporter [bacterium]
MNFLWAIGASIFVSLISFIGIISLLFKENILNKIFIFLVAFSSGSLISAAFFYLLPKTFEYSQNMTQNFIYVILGFIFFLILEKYLYWHHCHKKNCKIHVFTYLTLVGDGIHNFMDGLIIGTSFMVDIKFGLVTTFVIILHEIPQELGDFGVLLYGGFSKFKALLYNFFSGTTAIIGTIIGYYFANKIEFFSVILLPITAGGFIYIAACDLIPELHKETNQKKSIFSMLFFILGICFILWLKLNCHHNH